MAKVQPTPIQTLLYSAEVGQGGCRIISTEVHETITFEPVMAPVTDRRAITGQETKPRFSLLEGGRRIVFGIDDVLEHGRRTASRRLNSMGRYIDDDYYRMMDVLYFNAFPGHYNAEIYITPVGILALPIIVYNNTPVVGEIRNRLVSPHTIQDANENTLLMDIQAKRLQIVPESYGALMHYAFDPQTLEQRSDSDIEGTTLLVDIGYETTDFSLYEGIKYQRDRAESITRAGMGIVTRAVHDYALKEGRSVDVSRVDRALRTVAGKAPGVEKEIEPAPGIFLDVAQIYDAEVENLAIRIAQEAKTRFPEAISRVLLAGGGAYHLSRILRQHLPIPIEIAPEPEFANVLGGLTALKLQANRSK